MPVSRQGGVEPATRRSICFSHTGPFGLRSLLRRSAFSFESTRPAVMLTLSFVKLGLHLGDGRLSSLAFFRSYGLFLQNGAGMFHRCGDDRGIVGVFRKALMKEIDVRASGFQRRLHRRRRNCKVVKALRGQIRL
jgi:hypothetical protein